VSYVVPFGLSLTLLPRFSARVYQSLHSLFSSALDATQKQIIGLTSTDTLEETDTILLTAHLGLWCTLISFRTWISNAGKIHTGVFRSGLQSSFRYSSADAGGSRYKEDTFLREGWLGFIVADTLQSYPPLVTIRAFHYLSERSASKIGNFPCDIPLS